MNEIEKQVELARHQSRRATAIFGCIVGLVVMGSIAVAGLSAQVAARNGNRILQLDDELKSAQDLILAYNTSQVEVDQCERLLQAEVRTASRETQAGIARLVIAISTGDPTIGDGVARLQETLRAYELATSKINDWQVDQPLPCPVNEGA